MAVLRQREAGGVLQFSLCGCHAAGSGGHQSCVTKTPCVCCVDRWGQAVLCCSVDGRLLDQEGGGTDAPHEDGGTDACKA